MEYVDISESEFIVPIYNAAIERAWEGKQLLKSLETLYEGLQSSEETYAKSLKKLSVNISNADQNMGTTMDHTIESLKVTLQHQAQAVAAHAKQLKTEYTSIFEFRRQQSKRKRSLESEVKGAQKKLASIEAKMISAKTRYQNTCRKLEKAITARDKAQKGSNVKPEKVDKLARTVKDITATYRRDEENYKNATALYNKGVEEHKEQMTRVVRALQHIDEERMKTSQTSFEKFIMSVESRRASEIEAITTFKEVSGKLNTAQDISVFAQRTQSLFEQFQKNGKKKKDFESRALRTKVFQRPDSMILGQELKWDGRQISTSTQGSVSIPSSSISSVSSSATTNSIGAPNSSSSKNSSPASTNDNKYVPDKSGRQCEAGDYVIALYAYAPSEGNSQTDLAFSKGERIHVLQRIDDGWCNGEIDGSIGRKRSGIFPVAYTQLLQRVNGITTNAPVPPRKQQKQQQSSSAIAEEQQRKETEKRQREEKELLEKERRRKEKEEEQRLVEQEKRRKEEERQRKRREAEEQENQKRKEEETFGMEETDDSSKSTTTTTKASNRRRSTMKGKRRSHTHTFSKTTLEGSNLEIPIASRHTGRFGVGRQPPGPPPRRSTIKKHPPKEEKIEQEKKKTLPAVPAKKKALPAMPNHKPPGPPVKKKAPEPPKKQEEPLVEKVVAVYNFTTAEASDGDLPFAKGDIIEIVGKPEGGWWIGRMNGISGSFPANRVKSL
eukprot:g1239.t1